MTEPRRRGALALALAMVLLATGAAAGIATDRWLVRDHGGRGERRWWERRRPEALAERYRRALDLDESQVRAVEDILRRTWTETRETFAPVEPKVDAIRRRGDDDIRALLRPEQKPRFEEMVARQEQRRAAMRRGLRDGPPSEPAPEPPSD